MDARYLSVDRQYSIHRRQLKRRACFRRALIVLVALGLLLLAFLLSGGPSAARWKPEYANAPRVIQDFFEKSKDCKGNSCCGLGDGHKFYGDYKLTEDGGAIIHIDGSTRVLDPCIILKGPNPTGASIVWYAPAPRADQSEGVGKIYCFAPGSLI